MQQHVLIKESYTVDYAGFWWRLGAMVIDGIILWFVYYVLDGLWNLAAGLPWGGITAEMVQEGTTTVPLWWLRFALFFLLVLFFYAGFWAWKGATPGKMLFRLKITNFDGSQISRGTALLRFCGYIISGFIIFIGFFWIAFDGRRQGVHDKIAETFVTRIPTKREMESWKSTIDSRSLP